MAETTLPERQALTTVFKYLKKKNLKDTEEMLKKELGIHSDGELEDLNSSPIGGIQHSRDTEPSKYDESYGSSLKSGLAVSPPPLTKADLAPASTRISIASADSARSGDDYSKCHSGTIPSSSTATKTNLATTIPLSQFSKMDTDSTLSSLSSQQCNKMPLLMAARPSSLQPIITIPTTPPSIPTQKVPMSVPMFYQLATSSQGLGFTPSMMASICTLHSAGLVGASPISMSPLPPVRPLPPGLYLDPPKSSQSGSLSPVKDENTSPSFLLSSRQNSTNSSPVVPMMDTVSASHDVQMQSSKGLVQVLASFSPQELTPAYSELKSFAEEFKTKRIRLGYTQGAVGQSLVEHGYSNFAQSTISRFEQMQLSPTNAAAIKQILQRWLQEAESPSPVTHEAGPAVNNGNWRKRKKRAVFSAQTRTMLEEHFSHDPRPNRTAIEMLAGKLDLLPEEIRVWFCNKRQKAKQFGSSPPDVSRRCHSSTKSCSTSSSIGSGCTSPLQASISELRSRNTPSPKTNFTIEELSKSSVLIPGNTASSPVHCLPNVSDISPTACSARALFSSSPYFIPKFVASSVTQVVGP